MRFFLSLFLLFLLLIFERTILAMINLKDSTVNVRATVTSRRSSLSAPQLCNLVKPMSKISESKAQ